MENITTSEVAGLVVGGFMLAIAFAAPKVDSFIATSQRRSLGVCERCGGLKVVSCSKCKGLGRVNSVAFNFLKNVAATYGGGRQEDVSIACGTCQTKGHHPCPKCFGG